MMTCCGKGYFPLRQLFVSNPLCIGSLMSPPLPSYRHWGPPLSQSEPRPAYDVMSFQVSGMIDSLNKLQPQIGHWSIYWGCDVRGCCRFQRKLWGLKESLIADYRVESL